MQEQKQVEAIEAQALGATVSGRATGVFAPGQTFRAWQEFRGVVRSAAKSVWIEDAWLDGEVVALLGDDVPAGAGLRVLGPKKSNRHWNGALASLKRLGAEMLGRLEVCVSDDVHDRHVYVDGKVWRSSESFKDMAKKRTTKLVPEAENAEALLADFERRWSDARRVYPT